MEITEFTFYEPYWDVVKSENDNTLRDIVIAICEFMFQDKTTNFNDLTASLIWSQILKVLKPEKEKRLSGKTNRTRKWESFTFDQDLWTMLESLSNSDRSDYIKAICLYAFENKEPKKKELLSDVFRYFNISKLAIDLSIKRKSAGKKGGAAVRRKTVDEPSALQGQDLSECEYKPVQQIQTEQETAFTEQPERNSERKVFTIDSLQSFGCYGKLNPNNPILDGVDLEELYNYVSKHPEAQNISKHKAVEMFKNSKGK